MFYVCKHSAMRLAKKKNENPLNFLLFVACLLYTNKCAWRNSVLISNGTQNIHIFNQHFRFSRWWTFAIDWFYLRLKCIDPLRFFFFNRIKLHNISIFPLFIFNIFLFRYVQNSRKERERKNVKWLGKWKRFQQINSCRNVERATTTAIGTGKTAQRIQSTGEKIKFANILFSWDFCGMHSR